MTSKNLKINLKNMLRILYDDFDQKVKNNHDEMDLHHSYKRKSVYCKEIGPSAKASRTVFSSHNLFCKESRIHQGSK